MKREGVADIGSPQDLPSFEVFIRGCMRREPSETIVGECRGSVTMAVAIQAAICGHVLTTTIHANDVGLGTAVRPAVPVWERRRLA